VLSDASGLAFAHCFGSATYALALKRRIETVPTSESSPYRAEVLVFGDAGRRRPGSAACRNVLFLCPDNSAVSIIAEAILGRWEGRGFRAFSAGTRRALEVHPLAVDLLKANRIWGQGFRPKDCGEFLGQDAPRMDFVISLGSEAPDGLPSSWPGNPRVIHWHINEPRVDGRPAENMRTLRKTFSELETRINLFVLVNQRETLRKTAA
jgi:arsenate reductase (thioredoxin)